MGVGSLMKIKCLFDVHNKRSLIKNKIYDAILLDKGMFALIDESGEEYVYPPNLFEVVDENSSKKSIK